jgi:hypothetical protein
MTNDERPTAQPEPIPKFDSREEEAAFWDSHDLADYWDTFKPVRARFNKLSQHCSDDVDDASPSPGDEG